MDKDRSKVINIAKPRYNKEFTKQYDYLMVCNDIIGSIITYIERNNFLELEIKMSEEEIREFEKADDFQKWLVDNGFKDAIYNAYYVDIFRNLLFDFHSFFYASLEAISKNKTSLAFTLLRKPFKDILGTLEWIYVDKINFIDCFVNGRAKDLEITKNKAEEISTKISSLRKVSNFFELRFEKEEDISLENYWNNSTHLITTRGKYKTKDGNINFLFLNEEERKDLAKYYYKIVPVIMQYAVELIVELFEDIINAPKATKIMNKLLRYSDYGDATNSKILKRLLEDGILYICKECDQINKITMEDKERLKEHIIECKHCGNILYTFDYNIFEWGSIEEKLNFNM
ncbi:hypothetical protein [Anaerosphaera multitolerans]|uniref:Uncharacterized protein n=1 Tax=Anaerosphaera multitolerans TaxID=2487351 RepID=A0A437S495_9FIRM|nr:hypothetical protein [Anaerosphaera multitolerans]RVU53820.1 hypothetical protein EF514_10595 [Anaerosphaera multitolerans]